MGGGPGASFGSKRPTRLGQDFGAQAPNVQAARGRIRRDGLAISSAHYQDARSRFMNQRYIKWYTLWLSREFEMLVFGEKRGLPLIRSITNRLLCTIPRLRFAPLGITKRQ